MDTGSLKKFLDGASGNPLIILFLGVVTIFVIGSVSTGIVALIALFAVDNPRVAEILASISAGLAMPALALLTGWYAIQTTKMVRQQSEARTDELNALRRNLAEEIDVHLNNIYRRPGHLRLEDMHFSRKAYESNSYLVAQLDKSERAALREHYWWVAAVSDFANNSGVEVPELFLEDLEAAARKARNELMDRASSI